MTRHNRRGCSLPNRIKLQAGLFAHTLPEEPALHARGGFIIPFYMLYCLTFLLMAPIHSIAEEGGPSNQLRTEMGWVDLGAEQDRLRENHFGDRWKKRLNIQNVLSSRTSMNDHVSFFLEPVSTHTEEEDDVIIRRGYVRIHDGNTVLKVGRESLWWGPGRHGALLLSHNTFPFDLIQLGSDKPFLLPGPFSRLGPVEVTFFLTELGAMRNVPRARLFGLRIDYHPVHWISIGLSRITMFNGDGRPHLSFTDFLKLYVSDPNITGQNNKFDVNELAGADLRIFLALDQLSPGSQLEFYVEYAGEDEAGYRPTKPAILTGLEWTAKGRSFLIEYADNNIKGDGPSWYRHSIYQSGYTYRGEIIGHHMGPDADSFFARARSPLSEAWTVGIDFDQERHGLSSGIQEKFTRIGGDLVYLYNNKLSYSFRYQYERIRNLDRSSNPIIQTLSTETGRNHYAIAGVELKF